MVRDYRRDPVDPGAVERILDAGRRGPSAGWTQAVSFVVVADPAVRDGVAKLCGEEAYVARGVQPWLSPAPIHVVLCVREADYRRRYGEQDKVGSRGPDGWQVPFWWVDAGAALLLLCLAAVDEGLGAGFLDVADPAALRALLGIPADVSVVGLVTLGYAAERATTGSAATRARRPLDEVVHRERW